MERVVFLSVLAACSNPMRAALPDAAEDGAAQADAAPEAVRPVTDALVTSRGVMWSYGLEACSLELGCWYGGPTVSSWDAEHDTTDVIDTTGAGAMAIAGDDDGVFIVTGPTNEERYVKRFSQGPMSIPREWTQGPAVDATYVYWAERTTAATDYTLRRATRAGNGDDAVTLASNIPDVAHLEVAGGFVWGLDHGSHLFRVPVAGGAIEELRADVTAIGVAGDALLIGTAAFENSETIAELGTIDGSGSYRAIATMHGDPPEYVIADGTAVLWSSARLGTDVRWTIYEVPLAGGSVEIVRDEIRGGGVFAITPSAVLFDFTPRGFQQSPR